jgi:hypothetical protein
MVVAFTLQGCSMRHEPTTSYRDLIHEDRGVSSVRNSRFIIASSAPSGSIGAQAAQVLYEELLRETNSGCFETVYLARDAGNSAPGDIFDFARRNNYDVVIMSDASNAIDGSDLSYASISQQVRVFRVNDKDETLILQAKAVETGEPVYSRDFFLFKTKAVAAPPLSSLMSSIGNEFAAMICRKPQEQKAGPTQVSYHQTHFVTEVNE